MTKAKPEAKTEQPQIKYLGKISAKTLGFSQDYLTKLVIDEEEGFTQSLFITTGNIMDIKTGEEKDTGPWTKFLGNIAASNVHGEIVRSGELFLPPSITAVLEDHVNQSKSEDDFVGIEYELEIGVMRRVGKGSCYTITCHNLAPNVIATDPMALKLAGLMAKKPKELAPA